MLQDLSPDPWLEPWLPFVRERADPAPILELGCGDGRDTAVLVGAGLEVVAIDLSPAEIAKARVSAPGATFRVGDIRDPFPLAPGTVGVVVASLCLHYFPWNETLALVERIRATLRSGGTLLCRLNSTNDLNHGADGNPRIEDNYYLVQGRPKRFFDRSDIDALFANGWGMLSIKESVIGRYAQPKVAWEVVLERDA
jgi:SAM-dependent methyltransferase